MSEEKTTDCLREQTHPQLSTYQLDLLNEYSHNLIVCREYDEDSGHFFITLKFKIHEWLTDHDGKKTLIADEVVTVWRFDDQEHLDSLIAFLRRVGNDTFRDNLSEEEMANIGQPKSQPTE